MSIQPSAVSDQPGAMEVEERDIAAGEAELSDVDGDGISTLLEAVTMGEEAALDKATKPSEEQVKAAVEKFASMLVEELNKQGLVVAVVINWIDLTPHVAGIGFVEGEATLSRLPSCEPGQTTPATDTVEYERDRRELRPLRERGGCVSVFAGWGARSAVSDAVVVHGTGSGPSSSTGREETKRLTWPIACSLRTRGR